MPIPNFGAGAPYNYANGRAGPGTLSPAKPVANMAWLSNGDIELSYNTSENQKDVKAIFEPELNITPIELMRCQMLWNITAAGGNTDQSQAMRYIRVHHLERHFKFQ
jgi:hypothetical protein